MSSETALGCRMAAVGGEVAGLKALSVRRPGHANRLEEVAGSISDEAAFEEAQEHGRAYRQAD